MKNTICQLFDIQYPIIQGGMIWASGWKLVSAVSNNGGLGLLGSGSMYPDVLEHHIRQCKKATDKPFGVNVPLLYPNIEEIMKIIIQEKIPIVFTSAGNPKTWTSILKENGIKVVHVVSSRKFALKSQEAGVDAVVCEGFEAGGHNGREETTSMTLIPSVKQAIDLPLMAAGGIGNGKTMYAAMALGADGVQLGSRFVASDEASSHINFKNEVIKAKEGDTALTLKELAPVRLIKNAFFDKLMQHYQEGKSIEGLQNLLGKGRAKKGMFLGDLEEGELEIGQISSLINDIKPVKDIIQDIVTEFEETHQKMNTLR